MPSKYGYARNPLSRSEMIIPSSQPRRNNSFSDWYANTSKRVDYLSKLLSENDDASDCMDYASEDYFQLEPMSRCCGDGRMPSDLAIETMSKYQLRDGYKKAQERLNSLYGENKWMREMITQATDYGKMQLMSAEIEMLKAERDRLRESLGKVVQIEDKIIEYKQQACMARKYQAESENLRKELEMMKQKLSTNALEFKNQISDVEMQLKITQKERNEYRNKAERLQLQNDLLRSELEKSKDAHQSYSQECPLYDRNHPRMRNENDG